jgi:hypothetical protein
MYIVAIWMCLSQVMYVNYLCDGNTIVRRTTDGCLGPLCGAAVCMYVSLKSDVC